MSPRSAAFRARRHTSHGIVDLEQLEPRIVLSAPVLKIIETSGVRNDNEVNFDKVPLETTRSDVVTLRNTGTTPLIIDSLSLFESSPAGAFTVDRQSGPAAIDDIVIQPGESTRLTISFSPTDNIDYIGNINISTNIGAQNISLLGQGGTDPDPRLDIIFVIDTTGSMRGAIEDVGDAFSDIVTRLDSLDLDLSFSVVSFRDFGGTVSSFPYRLEIPLTNNTSAVTTTLRSLAVGAGGGEESGVEAVFQASTDPAVGLRPGAVPIFLLATDMRIKARDRFNDFPEAPPSAATEQDMLDAVNSVGGKIVGFSVNGTKPVPQMENYATETGTVGDLDGGGTANDPLVFDIGSSSNQVVDAMLALFDTVQSSGAAARIREDSGASDDNRIQFVGARPSERLGQTFTVLNDGTSPLTIFGATVEGDEFGLADPIGRRTLAPGETLPIRVFVRADRRGDYSGRVLITTNELLNSPLVINLEAPVTPSESAAPVVERVRSQYTGRFISGVVAFNEFRAVVSDPDSDVAFVQFRLVGERSTDADGSDGWTATFDMGSVRPGAYLQVVAVDDTGAESERFDVRLDIAPTPDWFDPATDNLFVSAEFNGRKSRYDLTIREDAGIGANFASSWLARLGQFAPAFAGPISITPGFEYGVIIPLDKGVDPRVRSSNWTLSLNLFGFDLFTVATPIKVGQSWTIALSTPNTESSVGFGVSEPQFKIGGKVTLAITPDLELAYQQESTGSIQLPGLEYKLPKLSFPVPFAIPGLTTIDVKAAFEGAFSLGLTTASTYIADTDRLNQRGTKYTGEFAFTPSVTADIGLREILRGGLKLEGEFKVGVQVEFRSLEKDVTFPANIDLVLKAVGSALFGFISGSAEIASYRLLDIPNIADAFDPRYPGPLLASSTLRTPQPEIFAPKLVGRDDATWLAYLRATDLGDPGEVYVLSRDADGRWSAEAPVTSSNTDKGELALALRRRTPVVVWTERNTASSTTSASSHLHSFDLFWSQLNGTAWTTPERITSDSLLDEQPALAFSKSGGAGALAYVRASDTSLDPRGTIFVRPWDGSGFGNPVAAPTANQRPYSMNLTAISGGLFLLTWVTSSASGDTVWASTFDGVSFSAREAVAITGPGSSIPEAAATVLGDNRVALAWAEEDDGGTTIRSSFYDPEFEFWSATRTVASGLLAPRGLALAADARRLSLQYATDVDGTTQIMLHDLRYSKPSAEWTGQTQLSRGKWVHQSPTSIFLPTGELLVAQSTADYFETGGALKATFFSQEYATTDGLQITRIGRRADLRVDLSSIAVSDPVAGAGDRVTISATIRNDGVVASGLFRVAITDQSGTVLDTIRVGDLAPGASIDISARVRLTSETWSLGVVADARGEVREFAEDNNTASLRSASVPPGGAVIVEAPNRIERGQPLTIVAKTDPSAGLDLRNVAFYIDLNGNGRADGGELLGVDRGGPTKFRVRLTPEQTDALPYGRLQILAVPRDEFGLRGSTFARPIRTTDSTTARADSAPSAAVTPDGRIFTAAVNEDGRALVFEEDGGRVTVTTLTFGSNTPVVFDAEAFVDPRSGRASVAVATPRGLLIFTQRNGEWQGRNLSAELGKDALISGLYSFVGPDGRAQVAGFTRVGKLANYAQAGNGQRWTYTNISKQLTREGFVDPGLTRLTGYVTPWGQTALIGLDAAGRLWGVSKLESRPWRSDRLDTVAGIGRLEGGVSAFITSWDAINIGALDARGRVWVVWWTQPTGWSSVNLTETVGAPRFAPDSLTGYFGPANIMNFVGIDSTGQTVSLWWRNGWNVANLTSGFGANRSRATQPISAVASPDSAQIIVGTSEDGKIVWLTARPGTGWKLGDVSSNAVPV